MRNIKLVLTLLGLAVLPLHAEESQRLAAAVKSHLEEKGDHDTTKFREAMIDLNGDGIADAIVLLQGSKWCGSGGCTMLVFKGTKDGFAFVSGSTITHEPIRVLASKTSGWSDLIVYSKGRGNVLMRFEGKGYPLNPSLQSKASSLQVSGAQIVMQ